jgi:hypothetical protein
VNLLLSRPLAALGGFVLVASLAVAVPTPAFATVRSMQVNTDDVPGLRATRSHQHAFRMIGVSWHGSESLPVRIRVHTSAGWQAWHTLDTDASHGPDRGSREYHPGRAVTEPEWVGNADGYQLDAPAGADALRVHLVRQSGPKIKVRMETPHAAADTVAPPIHFRSEWGARPAKKTPDYAPALKMAFVHHTATDSNYQQADVPAVLRSIQAYHMDTNGWDDIGYNFLVDRFGTIWEGRDGGITKAVVGAQTEGFNTGSTGVAIIGDFTNAPAPNEAVQSVGALLGWRLPLDSVDPVGKATMTSQGNPKYPSGKQVQFDVVSGHKDAYPTTCPGMVYDQLAHVRQDAEAVAGIATPYAGFAGGLFIGTGNFGGGQTDIVTGADTGGGPHVRTFNPDGSPRSSFFAYPAAFPGGVRVTGGNVDGLGSDEVITGAGPGGGPNVKAFTEDGTTVESFFAYPSGFGGGVYVAAGNVDGVLGDDLVTGAGPSGGPNVKVWTIGGTLLSSFFAYDQRFTGGVRVATADVDGDGKPEIITAPGPGGGPNIRVFRWDGTMLASFNAYDGGFASGVYVTGVKSPSGPDWIATGPGPGGGPDVRMFNGSGALQREFFTGDPTNTSGVRVAAGPFSGSGAGVLALGFGPFGPQIIRLTKLDGSLVLP